MKRRSKTAATILIITGAMCLIVYMCVSFHHTFRSAGTEIAEAQAQEEVQEEEEPAKLIDMTVLEVLLDSYLAENEISSDQISYAIRNLETNESISLNGDVEMTAASTYKLPLAMIYYEMASASELDLEDVSPSGYTYELLLRYTIVESDNITAACLYDGLGGWEEYRALAGKYTTQEMSDTFYYSRENITTALYMQDVLQYLYENNDEFSQLMEFLQIAQPYNYLNSVISTEAYQKYGQYGTAQNSVGLVLTSYVPYSIAIFTDSVYNAETVIGEINQICFSYFDGDYNDISYSDLGLITDGDEIVTIIRDTADQEEAS